MAILYTKLKIMMSNQVDHSALTDHWAGFQFKTIHDSRRARSRSVDDVAHTVNQLLNSMETSFN